MSPFIVLMGDRWLPIMIMGDRWLPIMVMGDRWLPIMVMGVRWVSVSCWLYLPDGVVTTFMTAPCAVEPSCPPP